MKLISMTDFVLKCISNMDVKELNYTDGSENEYCYKVGVPCEIYAKFLKQPLTLGMFVPCDEDGNFLEEPIKPKSFNAVTYEDDKEHWSILEDEYELAKERVLFIGDWDYSEIPHTVVAYEPSYYKWNTSLNLTIESIAIEKDSKYRTPLELTPSALKQIGI